MIGLEEDRVRVGGGVPGPAYLLLGPQDPVLRTGFRVPPQRLLEFAEAEDVLRQGCDGDGRRVVRDGLPVVTEGGVRAGARLQQRRVVPRAAKTALRLPQRGLASPDSCASVARWSRANAWSDGEAASFSARFMSARARGMSPRNSQV